MLKNIRVSLIALLLIAAGYIAGNYGTAVIHAQQTTATIPRAWGTCKGSLERGLVFEAADGTIRVANSRGELIVLFNRE
jgi:hypothetical protein